MAARPSSCRSHPPAHLEAGLPAGERSRVDAAHRRAEQDLVGSGETVERHRLLVDLEALASRREQRRADRARQLPAVERRGHERLPLDDPDVGERRLQDLAVEIHEQRNGAEPLFELREQAPVDPLVLAETAGERRRCERNGASQGRLQR